LLIDRSANTPQNIIAAKERSSFFIVGHLAPADIIPLAAHRAVEFQAAGMMRRPF